MCSRCLAGRSAANAGSVMLRADGGESAETRYFPDALADVGSCSVALSVDVKTLEEKDFFSKNIKNVEKQKNVQELIKPFIFSLSEIM